MTTGIWIAIGVAYGVFVLMVWAMFWMGAMAEQRERLAYRLRQRPDGWWIEVRMPHLTTSKGGWISAEGPIVDHAEAVLVFDHYRERENTSHAG